MSFIIKIAMIQLLNKLFKPAMMIPYRCIYHIDPDLCSRIDLAKDEYVYVYVHACTHLFYTLA